MRRILTFAGLLAAATLAAPGMAQAASKLEISPVRINLPAKRPMVTLHLHNQGDEPTTVHLEGLRWTQVDGKDQYAPDFGLIVTPPIATLPPGAQQTVRIGFSEPTKATTEAAYRLLIREVPSRPANEAQTVQVLLQVSVPVFAPPAAAKRGQLAWTLAKQGDSYRVSVRNDGPMHIQITRFRVNEATDAAISDSNQMRYVLPGSTVSWALTDLRGAPVTALPARVKLLVNTDQGEIKADVRPD